MPQIKFSILLFCSLLIFGTSNFLLQSFLITPSLLASVWSEVLFVSLSSILVCGLILLINILLDIQPTKTYSFWFCLLFGLLQLNFFLPSLLIYNFSLTYDWMRWLHQLINMAFINFHLCFWMAKKYFFASENKNKRRTLIIASSLFLYVIGLYTPAYYLTTLYQPEFGYSALFSGLAAAFFGQNFSGLGNIFYFYALRCLYKNHNLYSTLGGSDPIRVKIYGLKVKFALKP